MFFSWKVCCRFCDNMIAAALSLFWCPLQECSLFHINYFILHTLVQNVYFRFLVEWLSLRKLFLDFNMNYFHRIYHEIFQICAFCTDLISCFNCTEIVAADLWKTVCKFFFSVLCFCGLWQGYAWSQVWLCLCTTLVKKTKHLELFFIVGLIVSYFSWFVLAPIFIVHRIHQHPIYKESYHKLRWYLG